MSAPVSAPSWLRVALALLLIFLITGGAGAGWGQITAGDLTALLAEGRYDEARQVAQDPQLSAEISEEAALWVISLQRDSELAMTAISDLSERQELQAAVRTRLVLEEASLHFARGRFQAALVPLDQLFGTARGTLPGEIYLLAGMSNHALGRTQKSREAFASIVQSDPSFAWARLYLGRIALEEGEVALALRYFDSAAKSPLAVRMPSLLAGRWEALRQEGRYEEATAAQQELLGRYPHSLAALQVKERLSQEIDPAGAAVDSTALQAEPEMVRGRISIQLAAFSDRGRALAYQAEWRAALPDLRIENEPGPDGQMLYKVRTGQFATRSQAQTEAQRLQRVHGLEVIVVESGRER